MTSELYSPTPVRSKNLSQRVVDDLSARIQSGSFKPGERLPPEPELVSAYGISRTVVREAVLRLQAAGLVETRHGIGTFVLAQAPTTANTQPLIAGAVAPLTMHDVLAMLELRISVETDAAGLAASRRSDTQLAAMRAALTAYGSAVRTGHSTVEADFEFHLQIALATGNRYFEEVLRGLGGATIERRGTGGKAQFGETHPELESRKQLSMQEHESIYECIHRSDAPAARAAMFMHLSNSRERKRRIIGK